MGERSQELILGLIRLLRLGASRFRTRQVDAIVFGMQAFEVRAQQPAKRLEEVTFLRQEGTLDCRRTLFDVSDFDESGFAVGGREFRALQPRRRCEAFGANVQASESDAAGRDFRIYRQAGGSSSTTRRSNSRGVPCSWSSRAVA